MLQIPAFCAILGVSMNQSIISFVLITKRSLNCSEKKSWRKEVVKLSIHKIKLFCSLWTSHFHLLVSGNHVHGCSNKIYQEVTYGCKAKQDDRRAVATRALLRVSITNSV